MSRMKPVEEKAVFEDLVASKVSRRAEGEFCLFDQGCVQISISLLVRQISVNQRKQRLGRCRYDEYQRRVLTYS